MFQILPGGQTTSKRTEARDGWRLVSVDTAPQVEVPAPIEVATDYFSEPLEKAVHVLTVEELAWGLVVVWTIATRFFALTLSPIEPTAAGHSLFAYDLTYRTNEATAAGFHTYSANWIQLVQAALFATAGANDFTARILQILAGCLMVAIAFAMRPYLGRAGSLAMGVLLALSPTLAYFSRTGAAGIVSDAAGLIAIVLFMSVIARPTRARAAALGLDCGLLLSSGLVGVVVGFSLVATLTLFGMIEVLATRHVYLRARVWLIRYGALAMTALVVALTSCVATQLVVGGPFRGIVYQLTSLPRPSVPVILQSLSALALPIGFYDFQLAVLVLVGIGVAIATLRRNRFVTFPLLWTIASFGLCVFLSIPTRQRMLVLIPPAAMLGANAIEFLYRSSRWSIVRGPVYALVILTAYVQVMVNFVYPAPNPGEAAWARHANLYWGDGATTSDTSVRCAAVRKQIPPTDATVFHDGNWPATLRWYLRSFRPVPSPDHARLVVQTNDKSVRLAEPERFDFEEQWVPDPAKLDWHRAVTYFFTLQAWGDVTGKAATLHVNTPAPPQRMPSAESLPPATH